MTERNRNVAEKLAAESDEFTGWRDTFALAAVVIISALAGAAIFAAGMWFVGFH